MYERMWVVLARTGNWPPNSPRSRNGSHAAGFSTLELMATLSGRPLYESAGFKPVKHVTDPAGGVPVPLVLMQKRITSSAS